eukprot:scaffold3036_cov414-Prasinococcus_capsulatus_cf.AAC.14
MQYDTVAVRWATWVTNTAERPTRASCARRGLFVPNITPETGAGGKAANRVYGVSSLEIRFSDESPRVVSALDELVEAIQAYLYICGEH